MAGSTGLSTRRRRAGTVLALLGPVVLTASLVPVRERVPLATVLLASVLVVVVVAVVGGSQPALMAAVVSFLLANWFLTRPYNTLRVRSGELAFELLVFIVVAVLVSAAVEVGARDRVSAEHSRAEALILSRLTSSEIGAATPEDVIEQLREVFVLDRVELVEPPADSSAGTAGQSRVLAASGSAPTAGEAAMQVITDSGLAVLGYGPARFAADGRLYRALAESAARAWQERVLAEEANRAAQLAETDRVRAALLAAVSHDLRTPLAGIKASVTTLRQSDVAWTEDERAELLASIEESTDRLTDLVSNLLAMSRIQAGAVSVRLAPVSLDEVVGRAALAAGAPDMTIEVPETLPLALADEGLLERVLANLIDNARRFSPQQTPVEVCASAASRDPAGRGRVAVRVVDHGPGVPPAGSDQMFSPFQRLGDRDSRSGVGLGLAIARGFTEAMHGSIAPSETVGGGLTMTVTLPAASEESA